MAIRIAHTSDLHIDERHRPEDTVTVLAALVHQAREADVDLIVVAGDHFERRSTPVERNILAEFLQDASRVAPVVCVKGNHDAAEDLDIFAKLEAAYPVRIFDRPTATPGSAPLIPSLHGLQLGILAVPWFDKAHLVAGLEVTVDAEATRNLTIAAATELLTFIRAEGVRLRSVGAIPVLVGHIMVAGSSVASGQTLIGTTVEFSPADILGVDAAYAALGHIHLNQEWFNGRVAYSGSPNRCNFGEPEPKGWRLVTLTDEGEFVSNEFRELPARRMVLLEVDWSSDISGLPVEPTCFALSQSDRVSGALVRFRYRIKAQDLHLVDESVIEKVFLADGAHEVQIEAVIEAETRVRSEEIVRATSTAEKVEAFWSSAGITVDEPTRDLVFTHLSELEAAL